MISEYCNGCGGYDPSNHLYCKVCEEMTKKVGMKMNIDDLAKIQSEYRIKTGKKPTSIALNYIDWYSILDYCGSGDDKHACPPNLEGAEILGMKLIPVTDSGVVLTAEQAILEIARMNTNKEKAVKIGSWLYPV